MTKIGYEQVEPAGTAQGNMPPAIDRSLQGAPGSRLTDEPAVKEETPGKEQNIAATGAQQPVQPTGTPQPADEASAVPDHKADLIGYDNQIEMLEKARADYAKANETEEDRKKREKREKSKRIVAAVGDGIRALSNLYFTSQYAPSMYNPDDSQLAKTDARQEKLKAEREANRDRYLNYSLRIGDLENDRARTIREIEAQAEKIRLAREKAKREQEEHQWLSDLQPDKKREQTAKANAAESVATTRAAEAKHAPQYYGARVETEKQRGEQAKAAAAASYASANNSNASAEEHRGNANGGFVFGGKSYKNKQLYDHAVLTEAVRLGLRTKGKTSEQLEAEIARKRQQKSTGVKWG